MEDVPALAPDPAWPTMLKTVRNIAIIVLLAAAVAFLPGGATTASVISSLLTVLFLGGLLWFLSRIYLEQRATLLSWDDRWRALLYGAVAVIAVTLTGTSYLFDSDVGILLWFALMGVSLYALFAVWRFARRY